MDARGLTEVVGLPGVGKTFFAMKIAGGKRTLYISNGLFRHNTCPENWLLKRFESFLELKAFIFNDLPEMVKSFEIECVIIDALDSFLDTVYKPLKNYKDIFHISRAMKKLYFSMKVTTVVVNSINSKMTVGNCRVFNSSLGLSWCYLPNTVYHLSRDNDGRKVVQIKGGSFNSGFIITDDGLEFV